MGFDKEARKIREQIKKYSAHSLINNLLDYLAQPSQALGEVGKRPWVALLVLEWTFELTKECGEKIATKRDVLTILNQLWKIQHIPANLDDNRPLEVVLRALIIPQLKIQKPEHYYRLAFVRTYVIIKKYTVSTKLESKFSEIFGLSLDEYVRIALFLMITMISDSSGLVRLSYSAIVGALMDQYNLRSITRTLHILGIDLATMTQTLKQDHDRYIRDNEYFQDSIFYRKPFLLLEEGLVSPHCSATSRGVAESLINHFIRLDDQLRTEFTKAFEHYLGELFTNHQLKFLSEVELLKFYKKQKVSDKVADFVIFEDTGIIAIDAKGVEPRSDTVTTTKKYNLTRRLRDHHLKGIEQAVITLKNLVLQNHSSLHPQLPRYAIVVTHQDFFVGTGFHFKNYIDDLSWQRLEELSEGIIDLGNIHFLSIGHIETLLKLRQQHPNCLIDFLAYASKCAADTSTMAFEVEQYIARYSTEVLGEDGFPACGDELLASFQALCEEVIDDIESTRKFWYHINPIERRVDVFYRNYLKLIDLMLSTMDENRST